MKKVNLNQKLKELRQDFQSLSGHYPLENQDDLINKIEAMSIGELENLAEHFRRITRRMENIVLEREKGK